jgi:hypothetical protein
MAAITALLSALPLPVTWRLMLPAGTTLAGNGVLLAPGGERGEEPPVEMGGIGAEVAAYFLEIDRANARAFCL